MHVPVRDRFSHLTYLLVEFPATTIAALLGALALASPFFLVGWYVATIGHPIVGCILPFGGVILLADLYSSIGAPHRTVRHGRVASRGPRS